MPPSLFEPAGQQTVDMEQLQAAYRRLLALKQTLALRVPKGTGGKKVSREMG